MGASYEEQGTPISGYEEHGPYHCEDCIHRASKTSDVCVHPIVKVDPKLKDRRVPSGVKVNLERGCCKFVNQPLERESDEDDADDKDVDAHPIKRLLHKLTKK